MKGARDASTLKAQPGQLIAPIGLGIQFGKREKKQLDEGAPDMLGEPTPSPTTSWLSRRFGIAPDIDPLIAEWLNDGRA